MSELTRDSTDLELGEHPHFEQRWRRVQRLIFGFLGLLVLGGVVGFLGSGPLALHRLQDPEATIDVPRFTRARAPQKIVVEPTGFGQGPLTVQIDKTLTSKFGVESIEPRPLAVSTGAGGSTYAFTVTPGGGAIEITSKPNQPGLLRGAIRINGRRHEITQLVWP
jgi:hypothetical protein